MASKQQSLELMGGRGRRAKQLGTLAQGVSCKALQKLFKMNSSPSSLRRILETLRNQPGPLQTSLKKCVFEELYRFGFLLELLGEVGADIALSISIAHIKMFPADMMDTLRKMIIQDPVHFLLLSKTKQELLVDKILQGMGMHTGVYTEEEFLSLGVMATFVVEEVFAQLDRSFFMNNLEFLRGFCYRANKWDIVARILQEPATFGPVERWNQVTLSQVDRLLFFLPFDKLQKISTTLMTVGRMERLFLSQHEWEHGPVGMHCVDEHERNTFFEKQQFVLQFFLGFLKVALSSSEHHRASEITKWEKQSAHECQSCKNDGLIQH
ncbi:uncharacterized protein LOC117504011 [Thalassophryne amazonica]|uniref:uncharacterized protein LOC117504011 n=1 Tax=Thalassophryne amazonica TaxID=390379 RepID=UPI0014721036|nr:uncharacterized protein LOC117504011 [Thalassophryne amazonica]